MRKDSGIYLIGRIRGKVHKFLEQKLREQGITDLIVSQGAILSVLYRSSGQLPMKEIALLVKRDKSTVTYLVDKLVEKGYVIKQKSSDDARITQVLLTEKAWAFENVFQTISQELLARFYAGLSEDEAVLLEKLLVKVDDHWEP